MGWGFRDCCAGPGVIGGPARALPLSVPALGMEVELLSRVMFGVLVEVLPMAGLGVEEGLGLGVLDFLWRNGIPRSSPNRPDLFLVLLEDILTSYD